MTRRSLPDIYFIRHGETDWNAEGRYQGRRDIPLNAVGQAQADANGPLLSGLLAQAGHEAADLEWHVSPLSRTRETADRVRAAFDQPLRDVRIEPNLAEVSFGKFEGFLHAELTGEGMPRQGERGADFWDFRPEQGESYADVLARLTPFFDALEQPTIVVAHGGIARVFRHVFEDMAKFEVVNWPVPQNVVMHFSNGQMHLHQSDLPGRTF